METLGEHILTVLKQHEQKPAFIYYENGQEFRYNYTEANMIDGTVWVDPSYGTAIFMDSFLQDSVFTRMFFYYGEGLDNFELVYQNAEIRLFKLTAEI